MPEFVHTADAAVPFDYHLLPANVSVVLGYVGLQGWTPHLWTDAEIAAVHAHGLRWAPIVTAPQRALTESDGEACAREVAAWAEARGYPPAAPIFLDVERSAWDDNTDGARACIARFRVVLGTYGRTVAVPYLPWSAQTGWGANWTNKLPEQLPDHMDGWQWGGPDVSPHFDLSIFRPDIFAGLPYPNGETPVALDKAAQQFIVDNLAQVQANILHTLEGITSDTQAGKHHPNALVHVREDIAAVAELIKAGHPATVDVGTLAGELAAKLGPDLAGQLWTALGAKLTH